MAGESVEMQDTVDGDPEVNSRGSLTVGPAGGRKSSIIRITDHYLLDDNNLFMVPIFIVVSN